MVIASETSLLAAARHLSKHDSVLAEIISNSPPCTIRPHENYYQELVESIISQQLSVKAARSILGKFLGLFDGKFPKPEQILGKSVEELRTAGLSNAKAAYVRDLAQHVLDNTLNLSILNTLSNEEIIGELVAVKGIGEWTAHMFLMFAMGRLDILAHGDLGIKNGIQKLYGLSSLPTPTEVQELAVKNSWHPYESVACWYIWQSLDNA
jgi:DNA-3-methyladenine glycosylase II